MGRRATKAAENIWFKARMNAATYDERLSSREGAAELLGMSVSAVSDAELGLSKCMPVDKAVLMADRYKAPYLLNHYCLNECPIGCRLPISDEVLGIERVTVKLLRSLRIDDLREVKEKLIEIAADGVVSEGEKSDLQEVSAYLKEIAKTASELETICLMALGDDFAERDKK